MKFAMRFDWYQQVALATLLGLPCVSLAQTTPPAAPPTASQPAYTSSTPPTRKVNPPTAPAEPAKPKCAELSGVEKAECLRRDNPDDTAPAGVTPSMKEKQDAEKAAEKEKE